jgi:F0F1-type ATP synthase membrane subunit b/b'
MNLKAKCDVFLQGVLDECKIEINQAVQQELHDKHEPYKAQMLAIRDKALATKQKEHEALIARLTKEYESEVSTCKADFEKAIQANREEIARHAEESIKAKYDKFILSVSAIADEI